LFERYYSYTDKEFLQFKRLEENKKNKGVKAVSDKALVIAKNISPVHLEN